MNKTGQGGKINRYTSSLGKIEEKLDPLTQKEHVNRVVMCGV